MKLNLSEQVADSLECLLVTLIQEHRELFSDEEPVDGLRCAICAGLQLVYFPISESIICEDCGAVHEARLRLQGSR